MGSGSSPPTGRWVSASSPHRIQTTFPAWMVGDLPFSTPCHSSTYARHPTVNPSVGREGLCRPVPAADSPRGHRRHQTGPGDRLAALHVTPPVKCPPVFYMVICIYHFSLFDLYKPLRVKTIGTKLLEAPYNQKLFMLKSLFTSKHTCFQIYKYISYS